MRNPDAEVQVVKTPQELHIELIASLPSSVKIEEATALKFREIHDRRKRAEETLQSAIQAAVNAAQEIGYALDVELQALFAETLAKSGATVGDQDWSVDAGDPKNTYLLRMSELSTAQRPASQVDPE